MLDSRTEDVHIVFTGRWGYSSAAFNGFTLSGPASAAINSVTLAATTMPYLVQGDIAETANSFSVNWQSLVFATGDTIDIHVSFATPSPVITAATPQTIEHGQSTVIGTVAAGVVGDVLALSGTSPGGTLSFGANVGGARQIVYTAAAAVPASVLEQISYTVADTTNQTSAQGTAAVQLDAGPTAKSGAVTVEHATTANLTSLVAGLIVPGLAGDTETVVAVTGAAHLDAATHAITYTAPDAGTADSFTYTVQDQHGGTATGTVTIGIQHDDTVVLLGGYNNVVSGPLTPTPGRGTAGPTINGPANGYATIAGTAAGETIFASGYSNTILGNGGNDTIHAGLGVAHVTVSDANGNNKVSGSLGTTSVTLGDGSDTVTLGGYGNTITLGNGTDAVVAGAGTATVTLGGGNDAVVLAGSQNTVTATGGNDSVWGGQGQDHITLGNGTDYVNDQGSYDVIKLGSGNDNVVLGGYGDMVVATGTGNDTIAGSLGFATILLGGGRDWVALGGTSNTVTAGNGGVNVGGGQGFDTITLGSGTNKVIEGGYNDVISTGAGHDTITAGAGFATVHLGGGTDTVALLGFNNLVTASAGGHAIVSGGLDNVYQVTGLGAAGGIEVTDFAPAAQDVLNLAPLLAGLGATTATVGGYVHVSEAAGTTTTVVGIDATGHGGAGVVVATLHGAGAGSLAALQAHGEIRLF